MRDRSLRQRRYGIILAFIAAAILVIGFALKPRDLASPTAEPSEINVVRADLQSIRELTQRNSLRNTSTRFAELATTDAAFLLREIDQNSTAIVWSADGLILSAAQPYPTSLRLQAAEHTDNAVPRLWAADMPFSLYKVDGLHRSPAPMVRGTGLRPGTWIIADHIGRIDPAFVSGMFSGLGTTTCGGVDYSKLLFNTTFDRSFLGAGVFDIDGNLIGVLAQCDTELAAIPTDQILSHIAELNRSPNAPLIRLGFEIEPITAPLDKILQTPFGLVVADVWRQWPADRAGILPGDVLLTINNTPATSVDQVAAQVDAQFGTQSAASPHGSPVHLRLRHPDSSIVNVTLDPALQPPALDIQPAGEGVLLSRVSTALESRLDLRHGDTILAVDGHPATAKAVTLLLAAQPPAPALLTLQRGTRTFFVVVGP